MENNFTDEERREIIEYSDNNVPELRLGKEASGTSVPLKCPRWHLRGESLA